MFGFTRGKAPKSNLYDDLTNKAMAKQAGGGKASFSSKAGQTFS
jgi:hypothetical protein